jgi:hypothetical protein
MQASREAFPMPRPDPPRQSPHGSVVLPLRGAPLWRPGTCLELAGRVYEAKSELHITVLSRAQLAALREAGIDDTLLNRLLSRFRFRFRYRRRLWLLARTGPEGEEGSLVQLLRQPEQALLRRGLEAATGVALGKPVPHLTLYTYRRPEGIGIPDRESFRRLRRLPLAPSTLADRSSLPLRPCPR